MRRNFTGISNINAEKALIKESIKYILNTIKEDASKYIDSITGNTGKIQNTKTLTNYFKLIHQALTGTESKSNIIDKIIESSINNNTINNTDDITNKIDEIKNNNSYYKNFIEKVEKFKINSTAAKLPGTSNSALAPIGSSLADTAAVPAQNTAGPPIVPGASSSASATENPSRYSTTPLLSSRSRAKAAAERAKAAAERAKAESHGSSSGEKKSTNNSSSMASSVSTANHLQSQAVIAASAAAAGEKIGFFKRIMLSGLEKKLNNITDATLINKINTKINEYNTIYNIIINNDTLITKLIDKLRNQINEPDFDIIEHIRQINLKFDILNDENKKLKNIDDELKELLDMPTKVKGGKRKTRKIQKGGGQKELNDYKELKYKEKQVKIIINNLNEKVKSVKDIIIKKINNSLKIVKSTSTNQTAIKDQEKVLDHLKSLANTTGGKVVSFTQKEIDDLINYKPVTGQFSGSNPSVIEASTAAAVASRKEVEAGKEKPLEITNISEPAKMNNYTKEKLNLQIKQAKEEAIKGNTKIETIEVGSPILNENSKRRINKLLQKNATRKNNKGVNSGKAAPVPTPAVEVKNKNNTNTTRKNMRKEALLAAKKAFNSFQSVNLIKETVGEIRDIVKARNPSSGVAAAAPANANKNENKKLKERLDEINNNVNNLLSVKSKIFDNKNKFEDYLKEVKDLKNKIYDDNKNLIDDLIDTLEYQINEAKVATNPTATVSSGGKRRRSPLSRKSRRGASRKPLSRRRTRRNRRSH